ncbi:hypothetical protein TNCT1_66350 [Streptomyces sp. 1-11]|nr:hypothetical protein TNCT1_66350 [Streptomyces sp. 1-11]
MGGLPSRGALPEGVHLGLDGGGDRGVGVGRFDADEPQAFDVAEQAGSFSVSGLSQGPSAGDTRSWSPMGPGSGRAKMPARVVVLRWERSLWALCEELLLRSSRD